MAIEFKLLEGPDSEEVKTIRLFGADIYPSNIDAARMRRRRRRMRMRMKNRKLIDFFVDRHLRNRCNNDAVHGRQRGLGRQEPGDVLEPHGPWTIQKELFLTDVGPHWARLQLPKAGVEEHIQPLLDEEMVWQLENPDTRLLDVRVVDVDSGSVYNSMKLTHYSSTNGYVLNGSWNRICKDRGLQPKDKVGLYWDPDNQELRFSVRERGQAAMRI